MKRRLIEMALALFMAVWPATVDAHDDPIVTVRVMSDGFNTLNQDQVLGEISADSVVISLDQRVQGGEQVRAWIKQQMDMDLRIEIIDIGTPQRLSDGYMLTWSGRFTRQDWRRSGIAARRYSNNVVIHNGRITEWTATLVSNVSAPTEVAPPLVVTTTRSSQSSIPELLGIPVTLLLAGCLAIGGGTLLLRGALRK